MDAKVVVAFILLVLTIVVHIISLAIPFWTFYDCTMVYMNKAYCSIGLWKACIHHENLAKCGPAPATPQIQATGAMAIIGLVSLAVAMATYISGTCVTSYKSRLRKIAACFSLIAGFAICTGVVIYGCTYTGRLYAGFGLAIVAGVFSVVTSVFMFLSGIGPNQTC